MASTQVCSAASRGDVAELKRLYGPGGPMHGNSAAAVDKTTGETPLHAAARSKRLEALKWLLAESGLDLQVRAKNGETAAHLAAFEGWLEGVQTLAEYDQRRRTDVITGKDLQGLSSLHVAIIRGQEAVVAWICDAFSADSLNMNEKGSLAVHFAAGSGNVGVLSLICDHAGTNAGNQPDENNATPVYFAAQEGKLEAIKYLVTECGADPKARTADGMQPLHTATQNGHDEVVQWLVARIGKTALMETTDDGATAVHFAAAAGHESLLRWFFATPNGSTLALVRDHMHSTPLHDAIDYGHMDCLKLILRNGADLFAQDMDGVSPYSLAMENGDAELNAFIIKYIHDKHLSPPDLSKKNFKKKGAASRPDAVSHPSIPSSSRPFVAAAEEEDDDVAHPIIPKGSGFPPSMQGGPSVRTLMTMSEEIQAAQQEVMAHKLTSVLQAAGPHSSSGGSIAENRTRPMRQTSFRDLKPSGPLVRPPPANAPAIRAEPGPSPPGPPPVLSPSTPTKASSAPVAYSTPNSRDQADSRPSPDGQEKGPLSKEVDDWFSSPAAEAAAESQAANEVDDGEPQARLAKPKRLSWTSDDDGSRAGTFGGDQLKTGREKVRRSKRRKLHQQVPRYKYMPVFKPMMTPYGYMLTQTVMPVPVPDGVPPTRRKSKTARSPPRSGPGSPLESPVVATDSGFPAPVDPSKRSMKRKDSGRMPLASTPLNVAAMKTLAAVSEVFAEEDEDEDEEDMESSAAGPNVMAAPSMMPNGDVRNHRKLSTLSHSLTALSTLGHGQSPTSPFSQYGYPANHMQEQPKQASFVRWLFGRPPSTKTLNSSQSGSAVPDMSRSRRGSTGGTGRKSSASTMSRDGDFMIGLDEQSYSRGSVIVALAMTTSVVGMSVASVVPKKSLLPMMAHAAERAVSHYGLGESANVSAAAAARKESSSQMQSASAIDFTASQRADNAAEQARGAAAGAKVTRKASRKASMRRAASTPALDNDAEDARKSSIWEFDAKMESKASQRWGHEETAPVDLDRFASLQRQGPKDDAKIKDTEEERHRSSEAAERALLRADEEQERKEEDMLKREAKKEAERLQAEAAKDAKREAERLKREKKEGEQARRQEELARRQEEQRQRKKSKGDLKLSGEQQKQEAAAQKIADAEEKKRREKEAKEGEQARRQEELGRRQDQQRQRKQSKEDLKMSGEQQKQEAAAQKKADVEERKRREKEEKEAEKQRKIAEKKQKEEEKERRKEAQKEEKRRNSEEKKRQQQDQRLRKEDDARRKKAEQQEKKNKGKRDSTVSSDTAADEARAQEFLGQWESAIQTETGNINSVLDDLQATIDMDDDLNAILAGGDSRTPVDTGVSELALALQLSGQAEVLSETMVYDEDGRDEPTAWLSSAAFDASAASAVLSSDSALEEVARRPSLSSTAGMLQPARGNLGRVDPIVEAPVPAPFAAADLTFMPAPPPPAAPPNLLSGTESVDQVGFLESTGQPKPSEARKLWQQRSFKAEKEGGGGGGGGGGGLTSSGSSSAIHSMLSGSKTDLSGGGGRPGSAGSRTSQTDAPAAEGGSSELEYALNQRRKKAQNAFLSNYRKSTTKEP